MCGVLGIAGRSDISSDLLKGITELRHRGPNAWGFATVALDGQPQLYRGVNNPTAASQLIDLSVYKGAIGIAHARYATTTNKSDLVQDAQPLVNDRTGWGLVFNGHVQTTELREKLECQGIRFYTNNDGELLLNYLVAEMLPRWPVGRSLDFHQLFQHVLKPSITNLMHWLRGRGAYTVVGMLGPYGLFAFRDPHGFRPLTFATNACTGPSHVFSSETTALRVLGDYATVRPVAAGELIYVAPNETIYTSKLTHALPAFCSLESVYFTAADSILGGVEVDQLRRQLGSELAKTFAQVGANVDAVVPIPATANPVAYELAYQWQKPIGGIEKAAPLRSFLEPSQIRREAAIDLKYRYFPSFLSGRRVALVDDSIVRGTTMRKVIDHIRQHGAREVHVLVSFPPIVNPCYYGIDLPNSKDLLAAQQNRNVEQIREAIKADSLSYLSEASIRRILAPLGPLCMACSDGVYVGGNPAVINDADAWRRMPKKAVSTLSMSPTLMHNS